MVSGYEESRKTYISHLEVEVRPVDAEDLDEEVEAGEDLEALEHVLLQPELERRQYEAAAPASRPEPPRRRPPVAPAVVVEEGLSSILILIFDFDYDKDFLL